MTIEEKISEALKLSYANPVPFKGGELVAEWQSFTPFFFYLVGVMKPESIFEWGPGQSTNVFLRADEKVKIVSIESEMKWANRWWEELLVKNKEWMTRLQFIITCSPKDYIRTVFPDGSFDIVLVDGGMRYECMNEAERLTKIGGIILCHDMQIPGYFDSVNSALSKEKTKFICDHVGHAGVRTSIWIRV